jgi:hypothetical protein
VSVGFGLAMFESPFSGRVNQWRLSLQGEGQRQLYRCRQRPAPLARVCLFVCLFVCLAEHIKCKCVHQQNDARQL